jgi:hypothetical protein
VIDDILKNGPINGFPDNELEDLIKLYEKEDTEEAFIKVAKRLDKASLLVPLAMSNNEISGLYLMQNPDDKNFYMMAFTCASEYKKWENETKKDSVTFMIESLANIASIVKDEKNLTASGLVIDPYGLCITMPKEVIQSVKE